MSALRLRRRAAAPGHLMPDPSGTRTSPARRRGRIAAIAVVLLVLGGVATVRSTRARAEIAAPVGGPIADKWNAYGGFDGILGAPVSNQYATFDGMGRAQDFEGGIISHHPLIREAFAITNDAIIDRWFRLGRENWGYPVSDSLKTPNKPRGTFNHFAFRDAADFNTVQERSIYHTPQTGAVEVLGAIRDYWGSQGWEESIALFPSSPERPRAFGSPGMEQQFEGVKIVWTPSDGAAWLNPKITNRSEYRTGKVLGSSGLDIDEHGNWQFSGGVENQEDNTKQVAFACVLRASSGQVFSWSAQGQLGRVAYIHFPPTGQPPLSGRNLDIAAAWPSIMRGHEIRCDLGVDVTQEGWVEDLTAIWGGVKDVIAVVKAGKDAFSA